MLLNKKGRLNKATYIRWRALGISILWGTAKELPGVKELFEKQVQKLQTRKRGDIVKRITPAYYGWRDEEDGVLLELEASAYEQNKRQRLEKGEQVVDDDNRNDDDDLKDYLDVPSQEEVAQILLEEKKKALLAKFSF
jgi:pre-mRNA-splicing factor ISY1